MAESKNDYLKKCFTRIVDSMQLDVDLAVIRHIIRKELHVDLKSLSPVLAEALPMFLTHHMKYWPGWSKSGDFYEKKLLFADWYGDFVDYLKKKLDEAITVHFKEICNELLIDSNVKSYADKFTQTDDLIPKGLAPFQIEVFGSPQLLNTIVFNVGSDNKGVALRQHRALKWSSGDLTNITIKQLLTWPHVGVHLFSPVLSLSRKNLHKFTRYISCVGDPPWLEPTGFIERIDNFHKGEARACFTVDYFKDLASRWLNVLSGCNMYFDYLELFQVLMQEFASDMEEIGILRNGKPVLASNSSVLFNIGKGTYLRSKKPTNLGSPSKQDLAYTEIIVPMMETTVIQMKNATQVTRYLGSLEKLSKAPSKIRPPLPQITFMCTFCNVTLPALQHVLEHFVIYHKMEGPVMCSTCKRNFLVMQLTKDRWRHRCDVCSNAGSGNKN